MLKPFAEGENFKLKTITESGKRPVGFKKLLEKKKDKYL